jgi:7-keto-8-aminopelargonate synthetase-like enzyme
MSDDLIRRLRQEADTYYFKDAAPAQLMRSAADALDALQRERDEMLAEYRQAANDISARLEAVERERDTLRAVQRESLAAWRARVGAHSPAMCGGPAVCSWCDTRKG